MWVSVVREASARSAYVSGSGVCDVLIRPRSRDYFFTGRDYANMQNGHGYPKNLLRTLRHVPVVFVAVVEKNDLSSRASLLENNA